MTEIKKLEIKHLCGYLPYGLKVKNQFGVHEVLGLRSKSSSNNNLMISYKLHGDVVWGYSYQNKPILRPMSDLYKERNGKIDIVELAKMSLNWDWRLDRFDGQTVARSGESIFFYNDVYNLFELHTSKDKYVAFNQLQLFEYLFSHHYDVFGLLEQGLAINKNDIER